MVDEVTRREERDRYRLVYEMPSYHMKAPRRGQTVKVLADVPGRGSLLDVSCGRGEMIAEALKLGFLPVRGTEVVPALVDGVTVLQAEAHALPFCDKTFDVATFFDVIEHLVPGDDESACRELGRVARKHVLISTSNRPSIWEGVDLHINKRRYEVWDRLFRQWFPGAAVHWPTRTDSGRVAQIWRVDL